jgi:hypothetical protein
MKNTLQESMLAHVEQWLTSGLTKSAYCRKANLTYQTFLYYANGKQKKSNESGFTLLEKSSPTVNRIELHIRNGCFFSVPDNCSISVLEKLVQLC